MAHAAQVSPVVRTKQASPERWQHALKRALAEGISVRQDNASGMWVANSGTHATVAYLLEITGSLVRSCSCPAGSFGDPCCKHAARYYLDAGLLDLDDPEGHPPALGAISCPQCSGCGQQWYRSGYALPCPSCGGSGRLPAPPHLVPHPAETAAAQAA
jgi:hypothetical protein